MIWDVACIVFVSVTANHLGLIGNAEEIIGREIPILDCPKCLSFWCTLVYLICCEKAAYTTAHGAIMALATSFTASYTAIWLEMLEGFIDFLYMKCYGKIYSDTDNEDTASGGESNTDCALSDLQQQENI